MTSESLDRQPWEDESIPAGLDAQRIYEHAIAVGASVRIHRRQLRRRAIVAATACALVVAVASGIFAAQTSSHDAISVTEKHAPQSDEPGDNRPADAATTPVSPLTRPCGLTSVRTELGGVRLTAYDAVKPVNPGNKPPKTTTTTTSPPVTTTMATTTTSTTRPPPTTSTATTVVPVVQQVPPPAVGPTTTIAGKSPTTVVTGPNPTVIVKGRSVGSKRSPHAPSPPRANGHRPIRGVSPHRSAQRICG